MPGKLIATMAALLRAWNSSTTGCSRGGPQCDPMCGVNWGHESSSMVHDKHYFFGLPNWTIESLWSVAKHNEFYPLLVDVSQECPFCFRWKLLLCISTGLVGVWMFSAVGFAISIISFDIWSVLLVWDMPTKYPSTGATKTLKQHQLNRSQNRNSCTRS